MRIKRRGHFGHEQLEVSAWPIWIVMVCVLSLSCQGQTKLIEPQSLQKVNGHIYLKVTSIKTADTSATAGSCTIRKDEADLLLKNPKNEIIELNTFHLTNGINTFKGKTPWGADFTLALNWDDSTESSPHDLDFKIEWPHANSGDVSYAFECKSPLGREGYFMVTGPWKTKETSNLLIGFVDHPAEK